MTRYPTVCLPQPTQQQPLGQTTVSGGVLSGLLIAGAFVAVVMAFGQSGPRLRPAMGSRRDAAHKRHR